VTGWKAEVFVPYDLLRPLQNVPPNSHLQFDFLISVDTLRAEVIKGLQTPGPGGRPSFMESFHKRGTSGMAWQSAHSGDSPVRNWGGVGIIDVPDVTGIAPEKIAPIRRSSSKRGSSDGVPPPRYTVSITHPGGVRSPTSATSRHNAAT
jgi:hypothetical protein